MFLPLLSASHWPDCLILIRFLIRRKFQVLLHCVSELCLDFPLRFTIPLRKDHNKQNNLLMYQNMGLKKHALRPLHKNSFYSFLLEKPMFFYPSLIRNAFNLILSLWFIRKWFSHDENSLVSIPYSSSAYFCAFTSFLNFDLSKFSQVARY